MMQGDILELLDIDGDDFLNLIIEPYLSPTREIQFRFKAS